MSEKTTKKNTGFFVRVSQDEINKIDNLAKAYGMDRSKYVRSVALGYKPIPLVEMGKINQLMKVNTDLGRLGNLLKYWLSSDPKYAVATKLRIEESLSKILIEISNEKTEIIELVRAIRKEIGGSGYD